MRTRTYKQGKSKDVSLIRIMLNHMGDNLDITYRDHKGIVRVIIFTEKETYRIYEVLKKK